MKLPTINFTTEDNTDIDINFEAEQGCLNEHEAEISWAAGDKAGTSFVNAKMECAWIDNEAILKIVSDELSLSKKDTTELKKKILNAGKEWCADMDDIFNEMLMEDD